METNIKPTDPALWLKCFAAEEAAHPEATDEKLRELAKMQYEHDWMAEDREGDTFIQDIESEIDAFFAQKFAQ